MKSLFEMGRQSLMTNQYALSVTSQNIANSSVPFYSRRDIDFSESFYSRHGNGVHIADIRRIYDESANRNLQQANSASKKAETYLENAQGIEKLFDEDSYSISTYLNDSLSALNVINTNPGNAQSRELYLYQLKNVASRFNTIDNGIQSQQKSMNNAITADVATINDLTARLAQLNSLIPVASPTEQADLLDKRDQFLNSLSTYINFDSSTDDNNILGIYLANGSPLISGQQAFSLTTMPAADNPNHLDIVLVNGQLRTSIMPLISGGDLGGLLAWQNNGLENEKKSLDRLALVLAEKINAQQQIGIDINGNPGSAIFNDINQADVQSKRIINNTNNQGSGDMALRIDNASALTVSDYLLEFDSPTHYQLTRKSDNQLLSSGNITIPASIALDGFSLQIDAANFVAGDTFILSPTKNAAHDLTVEMASGSHLALGLPVVTEVATTNEGKGRIELTAITDISNSIFATPKQLSPPMRIEFISANSYRLINDNDNSVIEDTIFYDSANGSIVFPTPGGFDPGFRVSLEGEINAGDQFTMAFNKEGRGDNRNGLMLANLYQQSVLDNKTLTFSQAYHAVSHDLSLRVNSAQITASSQSIIKTQAESRRDQISGVSIQEETLHLAQYQQAYEASASIIDAGQKMFDIVIGLSRR